MAATETFPYDIAIVDGGATRISDETIGEHALIDGTPPPVTDGTELYAAKVNQISKGVVATDRMTPLAIIALEPSGGAMVITHVAAKGTFVTADTFSVIDHVTGYFGIEWDAGAIPEMSLPPRAFAHVGKQIATAARTTATSVEVTMCTHAGVDADIAVTVEIW